MFRQKSVPALLSGLLAIAMVSLAAPALAQDCPAPTAAEAEGIGRAYFDAFNSGDRAALDALLAADYRHQGAVVVEQDRALHLDRLTAVRTAFPDGVYAIDWILVDGDTVAIRHRFNGTQQGEYAGVAASGKKVSIGAFHVHRIACGKIAGTWNAGDGIGLFRQIGAIPGPATTPSSEEAASPAPATQTCAPTEPSANADSARRWYDEVLNQGKFEVMDEFVAEDSVHHAAVFTDTVGIEPSRNNLKALLAAFPGIQYSVDGILASGDMVLIRWTGKGTHTGTPFAGVATSGKPVNWSGMNAFRFACGKIVEGWSEANGLQILRQLGAKVP